MIDKSVLRLIVNYVNQKHNKGTKESIMEPFIMLRNQKGPMGSAPWRPRYPAGEQPAETGRRAQRAQSAKRDPNQQKERIWVLGGSAGQFSTKT